VRKTTTATTPKDNVVVMEKTLLSAVLLVKIKNQQSFTHSK